VVEALEWFDDWLRGRFFVYAPYDTAFIRRLQVYLLVFLCSVCDNKRVV
jgi:hypothetical protein